MSECVQNKENNIKDKNYWVYSLSFFPELLKRVKIILLIHFAIKKKLIKLIQNQRLNSISIIKKAYKHFKLINQLKKEYFIRKIISDRKKAIIKLQNNIKYYLIKIKLKKILRKDKGSYTIICNKSNVGKLHVKIFTDYFDNNKSMIFKMKYCPIRKIFFFSIPKTKFVLAKKDCKIVRFIFLYDGNIFFEEELYKLVDFNGKQVHEINFSKYDEIINENNINDIGDEDEMQGLSYKKSTEQKLNLYNDYTPLSFSSDDENNNKNSKKESKDSNEIKKQKFERAKRKGKTCKLRNPKYLKIISILKGRNFERRKGSCPFDNERHVKFGTVTFSY